MATPLFFAFCFLRTRIFGLLQSLQESFNLTTTNLNSIK